MSLFRQNVLLHPSARLLFVDSGGVLRAKVSCMDVAKKCAQYIRDKKIYYDNNSYPVFQFAGIKKPQHTSIFDYEFWRKFTQEEKDSIMAFFKKYQISESDLKESSAIIQPGSDLRVTLADEIFAMDQQTLDWLNVKFPEYQTRLNLFSRLGTVDLDSQHVIASFDIEDPFGSINEKSIERVLKLIDYICERRISYFKEYNEQTAELEMIEWRKRHRK